MTGRKFAAGSSSSTQRSRGKRDGRALPVPVLQRVRCSQGRRPERYPAQPTVRPARTFAHARRPDQIPRSTTDQARFVTRSPRIHATSDDASTTGADKKPYPKEGIPWTAEQQMGDAAGCDHWRPRRRRRCHEPAIGRWLAAVARSPARTPGGGPGRHRARRRDHQGANGRLAGRCSLGVLRT